MSGAARDLHVSQPSVSKVLKHAEDQLGFDLFVREKGRLAPTPAADELYDEIKDIYRKISSFNRTAKNILHRKGRHLRIGVLPSLGLAIAPEAIARMRALDTTLSFELTTLHSEQLLQAVLEKRCDLCIGFEMPRDERVITRHLIDGHFHIVSAEPLGESGAKVDPHVLDGQDFIGIKGSGPLASILTDIFDQNDVHPNEVVTVHTYHAALSLVRKGIGIAVTDEFTATSSYASDLHGYPIEGAPSFPITAFALRNHLEIKSIHRTIAQIHNVLMDEAT
ncbi:LysR family transcriptional regulator [Alterisphingorhabdus coralli]|uniref:LysR family transcriptional regulator n=1 Tax=Alterisphingorhabdus coralli TaxID=3071408 RepID=A0AA97F9T2_9SPHN|nr:LysR family transcriptional regulator [Parasphingorhabdus sp. SCSIO 66989]WOE75892.1 LysR family transcriptional regulator [Parasphingorhabdus sp. SCSIO 66989]